MNRIFSILAAGLLLAGCGSDNPGSQKALARGKTAQLREGMSQNQVERLLGRPNKVDHDDGDHHYSGAYVPYYGYRHGYSGEPEVTWEYSNLDLEIKFRPTRGGGWVVKEWDQD